MPEVDQLTWSPKLAWGWLFNFISADLGVPPASITEEELLKMTFRVPLHLEKELTWLMATYYEYTNKEAIAKDRVVGVAELRAVLRGRKAAKNLRTLSINIPTL